MSCKKQDTYIPVTIDCKLLKNIDTLKSLLPGTWVWLQEYRFIQRDRKFVYLTPKTEGYTLRMTLRNDTAFLYKNGLADSTYKYNVVKLGVISGTNFPEDDDPVLVFSNLRTGLRTYHVPILACNNFLVQQFQYVSSIIGEETWERE